MKRTEWLQETKQMRFEEAYSGWTERRLTQEEAARLLRVGEEGGQTILTICFHSVYMLICPAVFP